MLNLLAAVLFVLVWSTGFVAARAAVPHADPQLFLTVRMALTAVLLAAWAAARRDRFPRGRHLVAHLAVGAMLPGFYLCASWWSVENGMPAGIMSLLGALQPLPIAVLAALLYGERLTARSAGGIAVGLAGVVMVLLPGLVHGGAHSFALLPALVGVVAIVAMAAATLLQQATAAGDPLSGAVATQNVAGTVVGVVAYTLVGAPRWDGSAAMWGTLAWSVLGLSIAGLMLFAWLIRAQGATRVSVLLLLVPALAAVQAWALFGERLTAVQLLGFALALGGVLLARARRTPPPEPA